MRRRTGRSPLLPFLAVFLFVMALLPTPASAQLRAHYRAEQSCSGVAIDYSIHEGELGNWYTHEAKECSTATALSMTIEPEPGDRYFLVVPVSWSEEGTYGTALPGGPRPVSLPACMALQAPPPHCP